MPEISVDEIAGEPIKASKLKRPVDRQAQEMKERMTLPEVPSKELNDRQWEDYAKLLTPEMWTQVTSMYLYRIIPKIIIQLVEPTNKYKNIDKLNRIVNVREHIAKLHGGGYYRIDVNKSKKGGEVSLCQVFVDIPITEVEPILDYRMLDLNHPDNRGYIISLKARGILDDRGNPMATQQTPPQQAAITGQDMVGVFKDAMGMFMKMNADQQAATAAKLADAGGIGGQVGAILLEQMKQNDPTKTFAAIAQMKDLFATKPVGGIETILPMFLTMSQNMMTMQENNHKAMIEVIKETKTPKGEDPLNGLEKAFSVFSMIDEMRGGGGPKSGWEVAIDAAKEIGVPLIQAVTQIYAIARSGQAPAPGQPAQPGQPTPPTTKPAIPGGRPKTNMDIALENAKRAAGEKPAQAPPDAATQPPPNGVAALPLQPEVIAPEVDPQVAQLQGVLGQVGGVIVEFMKQDRDGVDLAQHVVGMYTKMAHAQVASAGEEKLFTAICTFPELWQHLEIYGEEKVKLFVHEFVHYEHLLQTDPQYMEVDEGEEAEPEEPVSRTSKRGKK